MKVRELLDTEGKPVRFGKWDNKEIEILNEHLFITSKPIIYLINLSERDYIRKKNKWYIVIIHFRKKFNFIRRQSLVTKRHYF